MKIVIATSGRAHLLDCARELQKRGADITLFSITPKRNFSRFGLKSGGKSLFYYIAPFEFLKRKIHNLYVWRLCEFVLDLIVYILMPKCDVFIAQSPHFARCLVKAKKKYGAIVIIDRGTSHVRKYNAILRDMNEKEQWSWYITFDEAQYDKADYIAIASRFVENSFIEYNYPHKKLFFNPYGVSLSNFYSTCYTGEYDCICVGQWSKRKGSHLVIDAFRGTDIRILHVGAIADVEFPDCVNFTHIESVPEQKLVEYYAKAKIFLFPSFEDGFGLVLCQAVACGLPIICSRNTGGPTLKEILNGNKYVYEMPEITSGALYNGYLYMNKLIENLSVNGRRYVDDSVFEELTWQSYGRRYMEFLSQKTK